MNLIKIIKNYKWLMVSLVFVLVFAVISFEAFVKNEKNEIFDFYLSANEFTANKIKENIEEQNKQIEKLLKLFVSTNKQLISQLYFEPSNIDLNNTLITQLNYFFENYFSYTLADKNGNIILKDTLTKVSKLCRNDIKQFAINNSQTFSLHRNPIAHHIDYMVNLSSINLDGVFFISFYPEKISSLLSKIDHEFQEALLMNKTRPYLVDFDVNTKKGNYFKRLISEKDLNTTVVFVSVDNSNWNILLKTDNYFLMHKIKEMVLQAKITWLTIFILITIILFFLNKQVLSKINAERSLRKHYQNNYFESSVITIVVHAKSLKIVDANHSAAKFFCISKYDLKLKTLPELFNVKNVISTGFFDTLIKSRKNLFDCTYQPTTRAEQKNLEIFFSCFKENKQDYYLLLMHDVTEKVSMQKQLAKKTSLLESIAYALPDMAFVIDKNGKYLDVLEGVNFSKEKVEKIIGLEMSDIFNADLTARALRVIKRAIENNETQIVEYQIDVMGHLNWYEGRVVPMKLKGTNTGSVLWLARDIQDKKFKEQELLIAATVINTSEPILIGNKDGDIIKVNDSFKTVLGYSDEDLVGNKVGVFRDHKKNANEFFKAIDSTLEQKGRWEGVTQNICKDGSKISLLETLTVVNNDLMANNESADLVIAQYKDISEMLTLQSLVAESEARFKAIVEASNSILMVTKSTGISYISPTTLKLSGYSKDFLLSTDLSLLVNKQDIEQLNTSLSQCLQTPNSRVEVQPFRIKAKNRRWYWLKGYLTNLKHVEGVNGIVYALENVTEIIKAETALKKEERKFKAIIEKSSDLVVVFNKKRLITYASPSVSLCLGYSNEQLLGMTSTELIHDDDIPMVKGNFTYLFQHPSEEIEFPDLRVKHIDGSYKILDGVVTTIIEAGSEDAIVFNARDVTQIRKDQQKIKYQAFYDSLTDLPNRQFLLEYLDKVVSTAKRHNYYGVVAFMDLDHFKNVNDTLGHDIGDKLLKQVALRVSTFIRNEDLLSRLGGDEFVIVLQDMGSTENEVINKADQFCINLLDAMKQKFIVDDHELYITPSIGLKLFSSNYNESTNELLRHADGAMYQAKSLGRNQFVYYDEYVQEKALLRIKIEADLKQAVKNQEFSLHYQPQYSNQAKIIGAEALIRWNHPKRGIVSPIDFIAVAEETGLIVELGQWILEKALNDLQNCLDKKLIDNDFILSINISTKQFIDKNFVHQFISALQKYPDLKGMLKVEITETLLMDNLGLAREKMLQLIEHGVNFSLDDFGTGFSSLQYLTRLPIDQLKIDRSFVKNIGKDYRDTAIVEMIISMAAFLKLGVVAEGVETEEQLMFLEDHSEIIIQGYYYSQPLCLGDFIAEIKSNKA